MSESNPYEASANVPSGVSRRTVAVKRIDVLSCGVMLAVLAALPGLFVGGIFSLLSIIGAAAAGDGMVGMIGIGAIIVLPLLYGTGGFIYGCIGAVVYNVCASIVGGIKMDLE